MAKYLVETYYTCNFKINHYLDDISENELQNLEKREDGKFEILDIKLDNRKTKNLDSKLGSNNKSNPITEVDLTASKSTSALNFKGNLCCFIMETIKNGLVSVNKSEA